MIIPKQKINFGELSIGDMFYLENSVELIECEKLTNNLVESDKGNIFFLSSSDVVIVEQINN